MGGLIAICSLMAHTTMNDVTNDAEWDPFENRSIAARLLVYGMLKAASETTATREEAVKGLGRLHRRNTSLNTPKLQLSKSAAARLKGERKAERVPSTDFVAGGKFTMTEALGPAQHRRARASRSR